MRTRGRQVLGRGELWRASCCFSSGSFATWGQDHESRSGPVDAATGDREMPTHGTKETKLEMGVRESNAWFIFSSGYLPDSKAGADGE